MGVLHGEGGAAAMAEAAVFWANGEGVAQCFGLERVEGNEGECLGSVERGVSGFGRGEQKRVVVAGGVSSGETAGVRGKRRRLQREGRGRRGAWARCVEQLGSRRWL